MPGGKFIVFDATTGEIKGRGYASETIPSVMDADKILSGTGDRTTQYVSDPGGTPTLASRPASGLTITPDGTLTANSSDKVRVTGATMWWTTRSSARCRTSGRVQTIPRTSTSTRRASTPWFAASSRSWRSRSPSP